MYSFGSKLVKNFVVEENATTKSKVRSLIAAYQKEYLIKDGTLNKFIEMIDFCAEHTQFPSKRLKSSMQEMTWKMGYIDTEKGINKGTLNEVIGVSSKDDTDKLRGKRSSRNFPNDPVFSVLINDMNLIRQLAKKNIPLVTSLKLNTQYVADSRD